MDRIIAKIDPQGHKIAFCSDTLNTNSILMWEPGMEPKKVSLDFYHQSKLLPKEEAIELAEKYEETWGQPTQLMVRLPRILRERPKFKAPRKNGVLALKDIHNKRANDLKAASKNEHGEEMLADMPRSLLELSKGQQATGTYTPRDNAPIEAIKETTRAMAQAPKPQKFLMRKKGSIWQIINGKGETEAYAADEADGLKILEDLIGGAPLLQ